MNVKLWCIYALEFNLAVKKNETMKIHEMGRSRNYYINKTQKAFTDFL